MNNGSRRTTAAHHRLEAPHTTSARHLPEGELLVAPETCHQRDQLMSAGPRAVQFTSAAESAAPALVLAIDSRSGARAEPFVQWPLIPDGRVVPRGTFVFARP